MISRKLSQELMNAVLRMPVVTVTGPRQSGKTTLVKAVFPDYQYVSLEDIEARDFARNDPKGFIDHLQKQVIIDEIQHVPDLFSVIQVEVDKNDNSGQFILTGSQNFLLLEKISQSLAGRTEILHLQPFTMEELKNTAYKKENWEEYILTGFYPRIYDKQLNPQNWLDSYIMTYIERDVRKIENVGDLTSFQIFLKLCAGRIGQLINFSSIANEIGVSYQTIKRWINILEVSFILFRLPPFYKNFNKRLVKTPKLYFYDIGLAAFLLGIHTIEQMNSHYLKGELFENLILADIKKNISHKRINSDLYFWRDKTGNEIDCLMGTGDGVNAIEIKSGKTIKPIHFKHLNYLQGITEITERQSWLIYGGRENQQRKNVTICSWEDISGIYI